ncbi:hypothetical protein RHOSPDRAFT_35582 [Rhodotorula sp. JG-1b]|nr:hypothetical protein RHOSPDRAFT_35582 [Rhodotorula sp. JG-1b]
MLELDSSSPIPPESDSIVGKVLRGLEVFFPFINLCILIAQAAFQSKWKVGLSARVILSILVCTLGLFYSGLVLASFILADDWRFLRGLERFFKQIRGSIILDSSQVTLNLMMAAIATASASSSGCKDPSKDPHADIEGYTKALPSFCRNKRASAAFFWLALVACSVTLARCIMHVVQIRKAPQTSAFTPPSEQEPGAHFPRDADGNTWGGRASFNDPGATTTGAGQVPASAPAGYRPSHDYSNDGERLFGGQVQGYGGVRDPFEDSEVSKGESRGKASYHAIPDPYEAIRQSMERPSPQRY